MNQTRTLAVAGIGILLVLLLVCAGTALIVSAMNAAPDSDSASSGETATAVPTVAAATEVAIVVLPPPGMVEMATSTLMPTNTPEPTPLPTDTPVPTEPPLPTATNTAAPVVLPTNPPRRLHRQRIPRAHRPRPHRPLRTLVAWSARHSICTTAKAQMWDQASRFGSISLLRIPAVHPLDSALFGVLPRKDGGDRFDLFQASWGNDVVQTSGIDWVDHIDISEGGSYTLRLAVCFDVSVDECRAGGGNWATLSGEIPVTVR